MDPRDPKNRIRRLDPNARRQRATPPRTPTGPLRGAEASPAQEGPFVVRLDPNSPPGEFNFLVPGEATAKVPKVGLIAEADGPIPPQLIKAVDEVLGFIYGLDQQFESQGRRPKKR